MKTVLHFLIRRGLIETRLYLVVSLRVEHQLDVQIFTQWQITQAEAPLAFVRGCDGINGALVTEDMIVQDFKSSNDYMCHTYRELGMNGWL